MGDLVQPGLERAPGPVDPDERVLGQVGGELRIAEHPDQVRVDLAVVLLEELLDERVGAGPGG